MSESLDKPAAEPGDAAPADQEEIKEEVAEEPLEPACMDLTDYKPKVDHFENIHVLSDEGKIDGAPNFRQVLIISMKNVLKSDFKIKDFPVFGSAQPTEEGFKNIVEKVRKECENKDTKMIWFNMRQEPVVYINSSPHAPRHPDHMHDNVEVGAGVHEMDVLEKHFEKILAARVSADSEKMLKINKDKSNTDNPMDRENVEEHVKVESVKSLQTVYEDIKNNLLQNFYHYRVPVVEETKPEVKKIICNNKIFYV